MNSLDRAKQILSGCLFITEDAISSDDDINTLGELDSLTFELIVMEIERQTNKKVDPIKLLDLQTVKDLAALLEQEAT